MFLVDLVWYFVCPSELVEPKALKLCVPYSSVIF